MSWNKITQQSRISDFLSNAIKDQRICHAYLFLGPDLSAKSIMALELAKALNCSSQSQDPCGQCISCTKIDNGNHPDVYRLAPDAPTSSIKISSIREMQNRISLKPYEGRWKIFIIEQAQNMTEEAQNALLKVLEEPPGDSVIILAAVSISGLLPTIISRCQRIRFTESADIAVHDQDALLWKQRILDGVLGQDSYPLEQDLQSAKREYQVMGLEILSSWFRDILAFKVGASNLANKERLQEISKKAQSLSAEDIENILDQISRASIYLKQNANPKLLFSVLAQKIWS